jgi:hypothetical protein
MYVHVSKQQTLLFLFAAALQSSNNAAYGALA